MESEFVTPPELIEAQEKALEAASKARADREKDEESSPKKPERMRDDPNVPEDAKPTEEEILEFWNLMLKKEAFAQDYDIKGLKFTLKSKSAREVKALMAYLDELDDMKFMSSPIARMNATLAMSLKSFMDQEFEPIPLEKRVEILESNPAPVNKIMVDFLGKFDIKVAIMMEEISSENF